MKLLLIITSIMAIDLAHQQQDNAYGHRSSRYKHYHRERLSPVLDKPQWYEPSHNLSTTQKRAIKEDITGNVTACVAACRVVGDKNPVCGTNNLSYENFGVLECAQRCGVVVELSSSSSCLQLPQNKPVNKIKNDKTKNNKTKNYKIKKIISDCIKTCSVTSEYNPVCGTNNVTYENYGAFECAKNCGTVMELSRNSSCSVPPVPDNPDLRSTTTKSPNINETADNNEGSSNGDGNWIPGPGNPDLQLTTTESAKTKDCSKNNGDGCSNASGGNVKKPSVEEVNACMQQCPMTAEVNPVCGTDGVTYTNPGKLLCTQFCGIDVKVQRFSTCSGKPLPTATPACPCTVTSTPPTKEECISRCSVSQELKPVCGSDGITYINLASLKCNIKCGVDVDVKKLTACSVTQHPKLPDGRDNIYPVVKPTTPKNSGEDDYIDYEDTTRNDTNRDSNDGRMNRI